MSGAVNQVRLAYLVTHPIQYQAPLLRRIASEPGIALTVYFASDLSVGTFHDPDFGRPISWDVPLLDGYDHVFLPAFGRRDRLTAFRPWSHGLARALRQGEFDALWVHGYARVPHLIAMGNAKRLGLKVLMRDDPWRHSRPPGGRARLAAKTAWFAALRALVDGVLAIGTANRDYMIGYGFPPERVFLMPYAVDNDFFRQRAAAAAPERNALRAELGLAPGRPVILFAGKLQARKRPDDLLAAYRRIVDGTGGRKPYLLIAGDGELAPTLKAQSAGIEGVRLLGFQPQSELPRLYDLADLFVVPSRWEPWGLVVNEAMNAGCAIVASDEVGAAPDLVRDGENGFVFQAGDVAALERAIHRVLDAPDTAARMGARSREIIARWGFEEDVAVLNDALAALLGPASRVAAPR